MNGGIDLDCHADRSDGVLTPVALLARMSAAAAFHDLIATRMAD